MANGRHKRFPVLMLLPALLLLSGCGPTREQLLQYEHVLAAGGILLGLGMWKLGFLLGGRLGGKGFLCPTCGRFDASVDTPGPGALCPRCGQCRPLARFDAVTFAKLRGTPTTRPRRRLVLMAGLMAMLTYAVLAIPSIAAALGARWPWDTNIDFEDVFLFPLVFALIEPTKIPGLCIGLFFYSYHFLGPLEHLLGNLDTRWCIAGAYALTCLAMGLFWYLGLRRIRWGWMVPVIWGFVNAVWATLAYLFPSVLESGWL